MAFESWVLNNNHCVTASHELLFFRAKLDCLLEVQSSCSWVRLYLASENESFANWFKCPWIGCTPLFRCCLHKGVGNSNGNSAFTHPLGNIRSTFFLPFLVAVHISLWLSLSGLLMMTSLSLPSSEKGEANQRLLQWDSSPTACTIRPN